MYEQTTSSYAPTREGAISTARLLGQVMTLVAIAIGFLTLGTVLGKDLSQGAAFACSMGGLGMLLIQSFGGRRFRVGAFAIGWLYALALVIGLGIGPTIDYFVATQPEALTQAAGGTALTVLGAGAAGFAWSKDLAPWIRPLSIAVLIAVGISLVGLVVGGIGALSPILSLAIFALSTGLILVYFNYLRKHATEEDTVWMATGIFVAIVNIFLSLLNLFGD